MFQDIKLVFDMFHQIKTEKEKKLFIISAIIAEAKFNNDLANVIVRSKPNEVAALFPRLFGQFSIETFSIIQLANVNIEDIFSEDIHSNNENTFKEMSRTNITYNKYVNYSLSSLYNFYIRKAKMLKLLESSGALSMEHISLNQRVKNLSYATRALIQKLQV